MVAAIATNVAVWSFMRPTEEVTRPVRRMVITLPLEAPHTTTHHFAISPDGTCIVYVSERGGSRRLYVRPMDELEPRPIPGTEGAWWPFFSPDSEYVGFVAGRILKKVSLNGGAPIEICDADSVRYGGATWTTDDTIIFSRYVGLSRVSAAGAEPESLTTVNFEQGQRNYLYPEILPNGRALLFTIRMRDGSTRSAVQSLATGERRVLARAAGRARYVPTGHLIYPRGETLVAAPFDLDRLEVTGPEVSIGLEDSLARDDRLTQFLDFSREGTLAYTPRGVGGRTLVWVDRQGQTEPLDIEPLARHGQPRLSPDGRRLAVQRNLDGERSIWVHDLDGGQQPIRLTFEGDNRYPVWTPDGQRVAFCQLSAGIFWTPANGASLEPELLRSFEFEELRSRPWSCSPDGKELLFVLATGPSAEGDRDIVVLPLEEGGTPRPILDSPFNEAQPMISPEGELLAYISDRSGRFEVWVRSYPDLEATRPIQVSNNGGIEPLWSRKGRELFYLERDQVMAVIVDREPELRFGKPRSLFAGPPSGRSEFNHGYDVAPDGRFVMVRESRESTESTYVVIVENWFEELERLAPTGK
jgi:serine/threonine-protein kinase